MSKFKGFDLLPFVQDEKNLAIHLCVSKDFRLNNEVMDKDRVPNDNGIHFVTESFLSDTCLIPRGIEGKDVVGIYLEFSDNEYSLLLKYETGFLVFFPEKIEEDEEGYEECVEEESVHFFSALEKALDYWFSFMD